MTKRLRLLKSNLKKLDAYYNQDIPSHNEIYDEIESLVDRTDVIDNGNEWLDFEIDKIN